MEEDVSSPSGEDCKDAHGQNESNRRNYLSPVQCWNFFFAGISPSQFLRAKPGNPEMRSEPFAFIIHAFARAPTAFCISSFLNPYLTTLAKFAAAESSPHSVVHWLGIPFSATSYVSVYTTVLTIIVSVLSPYMGVIADTTPFRRRYLIFSTIFASLFTIALISIRPHTWWLGGILVIFAMGFYEMSLVFVYAYLPEMGTSDKSRSKVSVAGVFSANSSQVLTTLLIAILISKLEPPGIALSNGEVKQNYNHWELVSSSNLNQKFSCLNSNVDVDVSSVPFYCRLVDSEKNIGGHSVLEVINKFETNPLILYQNSSQPTEILSLRKILFSAWVKAGDSDSPGVALEVRTNENMSHFSKDIDPPSEKGYGFISLVHNTGDDVTKLGFRVNIVNSSRTLINDVSVVTMPRNYTGVWMLGVGIWFLLFGMISFIHFGNRRPQNVQVAVGRYRIRQVISTANSKLGHTISWMYRNPLVGIWFLGYAFFAAGATASVAVAGVFFTEQIEVSVSVVGLVFLCGQLIGIPGAAAFHFLGAAIGYHLALLFSYMLFGATIVFGYFVLIDASSKIFIWPIALLFGVSLGSSVALSRAAVSGMIPKGREAEFMGFYNFANKVLSWLGTLLYTVVNESTGNLRLAFLSISLLFAIAGCFQVFVALLFRGLRDRESRQTWTGNFEGIERNPLLDDVDSQQFINSPSQVATSYNNLLKDRISISSA